MCNIFPYWLTSSFRSDSRARLFDEELQEGSETSDEEEMDDLVQGFFKNHYVRKMDIFCHGLAVLFGIALLATSIALIMIASNIYGTGGGVITVCSFLGVVGLAGGIMMFVSSKRIYDLLDKWRRQEDRNRALS